MDNREKAIKYFSKLKAKSEKSLAYAQNDEDSQNIRNKIIYYTYAIMALKGE